MPWALLVAASGVSAFVAPLSVHGQQGLALTTRPVLTAEPMLAEGRAHVVMQYDQPVYDQPTRPGMSSRYAATNIAFASLVSVSMGVLFSASPYADWSSGFLFAVYLLNVVSTLGKTLDAATCLTEASAYSRDSAEYERCVEAGALRVEAGEMTASELAFFKPPSSAPDRAVMVAPGVAPELFHFQALVTEVASAFTFRRGEEQWLTMNEIKAGLLGIKDRLQGFTTVGGLNLDLNPNEIITGAAIAADPFYRPRLASKRNGRMAASDTQAVHQLLVGLWWFSLFLATANPKASIILHIPLSNPNAYLLPIGYWATKSITSVLANNAHVLKGDACKCESQGYLRRMQAEARKAQVGVSESDLVEHAPRTMIEPIQPHVAGLSALASIFNGSEVLAGVDGLVLLSFYEILCLCLSVFLVPASEIGSNQFTM